MHYIDPLIGLVSLMLWLTYLYRQHLDLASLFAIVSRLRHARKTRGWSIEEAAWQVGVDTSTYHRWELGTQQPHGRNLRKLEAAFQMKASDLFEEDSFEKELGKLIQLLTDFKYDSMIIPANANMKGADIVARQGGQMYLCQVKCFHER